MAPPPDAQSLPATPLQPSKADPPTPPRSAWRSALPALLVLAFGISLSLLVAFRAHQASLDAEMRRFEYRSNRILADMRQSLEADEMLLRSVAGLFSVDDGVSRGRWRGFFDALQAGSAPPGRLWLGYAPRVPEGQREIHERQVRAQGADGYSIKTTHSHDTHFPVAYLRAFVKADRRALGVDVQDDPALRAALERAAASGSTVLAGPLTHTALLGSEGQVIWVMVMPHLTGKSAPSASTGSRQAPEGFFIEAFDTMELAGHALGPDATVIGMNVVDAGTPVFSCTELKAELARGFAPTLSRDLALDFGQRRWNVHFSALPKFHAEGESSAALGILLGGFLISGLTAGLIGLLVGLRARALALVEQRTRDLRTVAARHSESEARLRAVFDHALDAIITINQAGIVQSFNPAAERIFGWTEAEMLGRNLNMLMPEPFHGEHDSYLASYLAGGAPKVIGTGRLVRGLRKDGTEMPLELAVSEMQVRGKRMFCGIVRDVSERLRSEDALRQSERQLRSYIDQTLDGVMVVDSNGRYLEVNPAAAAMLGYEEHEMLQIGIPDVIWPEPADREAGAAHFQRVRTEGRSVGEVALQRKTGERIIADVHAVDLGGERYLGIMRDVTERYLAAQALQTERERLEDRVAQRTEVLLRTNAALEEEIVERKRIEAELTAAREQALQAAEAKAAFLANMSHEIRTPMNAVVGTAALLDETELDAEQRRYVETIRTSGDALLSTINDILDLSKVDSGMLELEQVQFELGHCLEDAFDMLAPRAAQKGIELLYELDENVPHWLVGDSTRLRQVLVNLLSNSVKFTERGEVCLSASVIGPDGDGLMLRFQVRDSGIGIADAHREHLFKAFSQADTSTTRKYGGTGLGLAISARLVRLMGGEIGVQSEENKGSVFSFTMRAGVVRNAPPARYPSGHAPELSGRRTLLVGGNRTHLMILKTQCTRWGMEVAAATRGTHALAILEAEPAFDVAVLDLHLPGMDGLSLARAISVQCGDKAPALVLLAAPGGRGADAATMSLFAARLAKPVKHSQLFAVLNEVLHTGARPAPTAAPQRIDGSLAQRLPMRILVVEDSAINQRLAAGMLRKFGYDCDLAGDGAEAVEMVSLNPYDLVLMDLQMPLMDGLEATRRIVASQPPQRRPRIVAMTANALPIDRQRCLDAGMDDYLAKPILPATIHAVLERWAPQNAGDHGVSLDASLVDAAIIEELKSLDEQGAPSMLRGLLSDYLNDSAPTLSALMLDCQHRDAPGLVRRAHKLAGVSASLGASAVAEICRRIERYAAGGDLRPVPDLLEDLQTQLALTRAEFEKLV